MSGFADPQGGWEKGGIGIAARQRMKDIQDLGDDKSQSHQKQRADDSSVAGQSASKEKKPRSRVWAGLWYACSENAAPEYVFMIEL